MVISTLAGGTASAFELLPAAVVEAAYRARSNSRGAVELKGGVRSL